MRIIFLLLISICFVNCKKSSRTALSNIEAHIQYQDEKSLGNVAVEYAEIVAKHPGSAEAHYLYARCIKDSDPEQYLAHLRKAIQLNPDFCYALLAIAEDYQFSNEGNEKYYIERCLQADPMNANALKKLIIHYNRRSNEESNFAITKDNYIQLIKFCTKYLTLTDLKSTEFYENVFIEKQRAEAALEKLTKCEKIAGTYTGDHYVGLGLVRDNMRINSDCYCVYKSEYNSWNYGLMTNEESGPLINLIVDTIGMRASGNFKGTGYGDNHGREYHFSWDTYHITLTIGTEVATMYCFEKKPKPSNQENDNAQSSPDWEKLPEENSSIKDLSQNDKESNASSMIVNAERAYFYKDPLNDSRLSAFCIKGDLVNTKEKNGQWIWASFTKDNTETFGWMKLADLSSNGVEIETEHGFAIAITDKLGIRKGPALDEEIIYTMKNGEVASYLGRKTLLTTRTAIGNKTFNEPWYLLMMDSGEQGWVNGCCVSLTLNSSQSARD